MTIGILKGCIAPNLHFVLLCRPSRFKSIQVSALKYFIVGLSMAVLMLPVTAQTGTTASTANGMQSQTGNSAVNPMPAFSFWSNY